MHGAHELVAFAGQIVAAALRQDALILLPTRNVTRLEIEIRSSTEGDWFWRVDRVDIRVPLAGVAAGVIERYDP